MRTILQTFNYIKWIIIFFLVIFLFFSVNPFVNIEPGHRGIVIDKFRGGVQTAKESILTEGLHFRIPFVQNILQLPVKTQKIVFANSDNSKLSYTQNRAIFKQSLNNNYVSRNKNFGTMVAASSDLQDVFVDAIITYHLDPDNIGKIYQEIGLDYEAKKVVPAAIDATKTYTAKFKVADILTKREEIKDLVFENLKVILEKENIILEDVNLVNFDFNPQFKASIEEKQIEEQKAQKEEYLLKQKEIRAQQKVKDAEANKKAKILEGEGVAKYNKLIEQEITEKVLKYKALENAKIAIEKWDGKYPSTYFGGKDSMIPLINIKETIK